MADRSRVEKLVGMLGSKFDGERANAAGMLQKLADAEKTTILDLLANTLSRKSGAGAVRTVYLDRIVEKVVYRDRIIEKIVYRNAPENGHTSSPMQPAQDVKEALDAYTAQSKSKGKTKGAASYIDRMEIATSCEDRLTDWERTFISDILPRLKAGMEPSAKQRQTMAVIWDKVK